MANSRSARKRIRSNERKHLRNKAVRSSVRTKITKARRVLLGGESVDVEVELKAAVRALDRASEKGILHRNNAARRKSRLTSMAAKLARAAQAGPDDANAVAVRTAAAGGEKGKSGRAAKGGSKTAAARSKAAARTPAASRSGSAARTAAAAKAPAAAANKAPAGEGAKSAAGTKASAGTASKAKKAPAASKAKRT